MLTLHIYSQGQPLLGIDHSEFLRRGLSKYQGTRDFDLEKPATWQIYCPNCRYPHLRPYYEAVDWSKAVDYLCDTWKACNSPPLEHPGVDEEYREGIYNVKLPPITDLPSFWSNRRLDSSIDALSAPRFPFPWGEEVWWDYVPKRYGTKDDMRHCVIFIPELIYIGQQLWPSFPEFWANMTYAIPAKNPIRKFHTYKEINKALRKANDNHTTAAASLGISRKYFDKRLHDEIMEKLENEEDEFIFLEDGRRIRKSAKKPMIWG